MLVPYFVIFLHIILVGIIASGLYINKGRSYCSLFSHPRQYYYSYILFFLFKLKKELIVSVILKLPFFFFLCSLTFLFFPVWLSRL